MPETAVARAYHTTHTGSPGHLLNTPSHQKGICSSTERWTGLGGIPSPRLHAFLQSSINVAEKLKPVAVGVAEESERRFPFEAGKRGIAPAPLFPPCEAPDTESAANGGSQPPHNWPLPLPSNKVGMTTRKLSTPEAENKHQNHPPSFHFQVPGSNSEPHQPTLPSPPFEEHQKYPPILAPDEIHGRSRLVSITPSLLKELGLQEDEGGEDVLPAVEWEADSMQTSKKRAIHLPMLSSFSTDTSAAAIEEEEGENETGQANYLALKTVPGQLNLLEIQSGNPELGRVRSVKRKPVLGRLRIEERQDQGSDSPSGADERFSSDFQQGVKRLSRYQRAHPPSDHYVKKPLSDKVHYEGYSIRINHGIYVPLNMTTPPLAVDQNLLYKVVPRWDIDDGTGTVFHAMIPHGVNQARSLQGGLYKYDEASRGFMFAGMSGEKHRDRDNPWGPGIASPDDAPKESSNNIHLQQAVIDTRTRQTSEARPLDERSGKLDDGNAPASWKGRQSAMSNTEAKLPVLDCRLKGVDNMNDSKGTSHTGIINRKSEGERSRWNSAHEETEGSGENWIFVKRNFGVDMAQGQSPIPPSKGYEDSGSDIEVEGTKRKFSLNSQSWLQVAEATPVSTSGNDGRWSETSAVVNEEYIHKPVVQTGANNRSFSPVPRLPLYEPPQNKDAKQQICSQLLLPPLTPPMWSLQTETGLPPLPPLPPLQVPQQTPPVVPPKPSKRYVTITLILYRSRNEPPRTTKISISVFPNVKGFDDERFFRRVRREYITMSGGHWRVWCGLRGVKWVGINEVRRSHPSVA